MKAILPFLLITSSSLAFAQEVPGMDQQSMNALMQHAEEIQTCMQNIDMQELERLKQQAEQLQADVKTLCQAGKKQEAVALATEFATNSMATPAMQQMQHCSQLLEGVIPQAAQLKNFNPESINDGICN